MNQLLRSAHRRVSRSNLSLHTLLGLSFATLGLVLTCGAALVFERTATARVQEDLAREVSGAASQIREKLDIGMFERWRDIQIASSLDTIRSAQTTFVEKKAVLRKLQETYPDYAIVALVGPEGRVLATSSGLAEGGDVSTREYFIQGRTAPFVGDVHDALLLAKLLPQPGGEPARFLDVASPIRRPDGSFGGIIVAHLYWAWAEKIERAVLKHYETRLGAEALILASDGTVLLGNPSLRGVKLDVESARLSRSGKAGSIQERWPDGRTYITGFEQTRGYNDYPGLGWTVLVRQNLDEGLAPARQQRWVIILACLIASFLAVLLSILLARWIARPLVKLTKAAEAALGSSSPRLPSIGGYAELTSLSHSLGEVLAERGRREGALVQAQKDAQEAEALSREKEASFRLLFRANPVPMYVCSSTSTAFLAVNDAALDFYGFDRNQFLSMTLFDIRPPSEHERLRSILCSLSNSYEADEPWLHFAKDGSIRQVLPFCRRLSYEGSAAVLVAVIDVSERLKALAELNSTREFLNTIVESMPAMLVVKDARDHRFVLVNKAGEDLLGVPRADMIGKSDHDFFPKEQADNFRGCDRAVIESGELNVIAEEPVTTRHNGVRYVRTKKLPVFDEHGQPKYLLALSEDITERRAAEARIAHMAHHDALTGLPNRVLFREYLEDGLSISQERPGRKIAVLYLDLDRFKDVNDTFGHPFGDELLISVGKRLRSCIRDGDTVARLGGDEFGIIQAISTAEEAHEVSALAQRILDALIEPFQIQGQTIMIGASIGVGIAPGDGDSAEGVCKSADMALYRAKEDGRATYRFFEPEMDARLQARRALEADLRKAVALNAFELAYQPLVRIETGEITGVEALVRWNDPVRGAVSPADFIPAAEETGLIVPLGEWVLRTACAEVASWPGDLNLAVNFSPVQFRRGDVVGIIDAALHSSGLSASRLQAEITESALLQEDGSTLAQLETLRAMGVRISMDDFGTGYSSLSYLKKYPFDKIKIDQSFVRGISHGTGSLAIVQAVAGLGRALGLAVTAEGVETEEQLILLRAVGCCEAQGYFFSRPLSASGLRELLSERHRSVA